MIRIRQSPHCLRVPGTLRECAASGADFARRHARTLRACAPAALARRLGVSEEPARRAMGALIEAALAEGDRTTALKLAATAARGADRRAEKILSHRYRFVWICNPKAASRSLIAALRAADPDAALIRHRTLEEVYACHPAARSYFSFAFLRDPLARTRSFYADKHALARRDRTAYRWFIRPWCGMRLGMSFAELVRWLDTPCGADAFADRHWLSQWRQIGDERGRLPDFLGRCERLEADWRTLSARLGLPAVPLPRLNSGDPDLLRASAPDPGIDTLLRRRYARDYEIGGYGAAP